MATRIAVMPSAAHIGELVAREILDRAREAERFTVGFPAGRTAAPVAEALSRIAHEDGIRLDSLSIVMMDEYVTGRPGAWEPLPTTEPHSCIGWAQRNLVAPLEDLGFRRTGFLAPDPNHPEQFAQTILATGGIDLFLLASGQGDGHVALNPPGTSRGARTRIVQLLDSTRRDNLSTFPSLRTLADVPTHGVTIGTADLVDLSRSVAMLLWGANKAYAFDRISRAHTYDPLWPATIVHECHNPVIYADEEAADSSPREGVS